MVNAQSAEVQLIAKVLGYLRTHWWIFVLEVLVIFGAAIRTHFRTVPVYESGAQILIDTSSKSNITMGLLGYQRGETATKRQNTASLFTSQEAFERFRTVLTDYFNQEGRPTALRDFFPNGDAIPADAFRGMIQLGWDKNNDIFNISCYASQPQAAYALCLNYVNMIENYYPEVGLREALMRRDFIARQIKSYNRQIQENLNNFSEFQKRSQEFVDYVMKGTDEKGYQMLKAELNTLLRKNDANRAIRRLLLSAPSAKKGELSARNGAIDELTKRLAELKYQEELTRVSRSADRDSRLMVLKEEIDRLTIQLGTLNEQEVNAVVKNPLPSSELRKRLAELEVEYKTNLVSINSIEKEMADIRGKEARFQPERLQLERIQGEIEHQRRLLGRLYEKEQETELELAAGTANVFRLIEPTIRPQKISPVASRAFFGALSASLFVISLTVWLLIGLFPRLDTEGEVVKMNLPILGKVPQLSLMSNGSFDEVPSAGFEYLRIMNYRILRETKDLACPLIVVSSSHSREGKSTLIQLLALASQVKGRKTLVIDGDLITSHPNRFFGLDEDTTPGLKSIIEGTSKVGAMSLYTPSVHEGIYLLPRGGRMEPTGNPNYLEPLRPFLESWRKEFNMILIDTPPIFAGNLAHQYTGIADLVILVARLFYTRPRDIQEALQTTKLFTKAPLGVALNCINITGPAKKASNYYFSKRTKPTRMAA